MMKSERPPATTSPRPHSGTADAVVLASPSSAECRVRVVADLKELRSLETAHQALFASAAAPHVGTAFPYVIADAATGSQERPWKLFAAYRDGELAGCLYGRRLECTVMRMRIPVFELGAKFVADPLLGPVEQGGTLRRLIEALQQSQRDCAMFVFPRLSAASFEQLARTASELGLPWQWQGASYAYAFDMTIELDEFLARIDGKQRRELNRRGRRLARDHGGEFLREEGLGVEDDIARFEAFMALEDSGWKGLNGSSIRRRPGYEPYFRELVWSASRGRLLLWYTLRADDRPIAMYMALRTHDTLWLPKVGYDERFAEHAPGLLLKHSVLLECVANAAITRVDNISAAPWLRLWNPAQIPFRSMTLFSRNPRSTLAYRALAAKRLARRLMRRPEVDPGPGDRPYL
jgi:CelD/BcsL family acetyltransferase involved in cellulose biosynthesis